MMMSRLMVWVTLVLAFVLTERVAMADEEPVTAKQAVTNPPFAMFQNDGNVFVLTSDLVYKIEKTGRIIVVPGGFVTDFASVPRAAQSIISVVGKHSVPAVVHDFLYWEQTCTRQQADDIFAEAMKEYGSPWYQISAVYWTVRAGAGGAWDENTAERQKGLPRVLTKESLPLPTNVEWAKYRQQLFDQGLHAQPLVPGATPPDYCKLDP